MKISPDGERERRAGGSLDIKIFMVRMNSIRIVDVARLRARGLRGVVDGLREREHVAKNPERVLRGDKKFSYPDIVGFVWILP